MIPNPTRRRDPFASMWEDACELIERAERLQRRFFHRAGSGFGVPVWEPPIDVFESRDRVSVQVALPGVPPERVTVILDAGTLLVRGERGAPDVAQLGYIRRLEIPHGRFERRIDLLPGHYELERNELQHGCLILVLRKLL